MRYKSLSYENNTLSAPCYFVCCWLSKRAFSNSTLNSCLTASTNTSVKMYNKLSINKSFYLIVLDLLFSSPSFSQGHILLKNEKSGLEKLVKEDLSTGFFAYVKPPDRDANGHALALFDMCVLGFTMQELARRGPET